MMNVFSLVEDSKEIKKKFPDSETAYQFLKDNEFIGVASINKKDDDKIYIMIKKELRGNGYGKELFTSVLQKLKEMDYKKTIVKFERNNIQMLKIVTSNGGKHVSTDNDIVKYLIPID